MATTTKTRTTPAQRETLLTLIRAAEAAKEAAAAAATAKKELENAERAAMAILSESRTIRDDSGALRTIRISLDKSFSAAGTPEERVQFAQEHGLPITEPDCKTASLKTAALAAMAVGLLVPVPKIVID
jgi:hypothetical protein